MMWRVPVKIRFLPVVEQMGLVDNLRAAATHATGIRFVDSAGRLSRRIPMPTGRIVRPLHRMAEPLVPANPTTPATLTPLRDIVLYRCPGI
jgi:hypothetical protein